MSEKYTIPVAAVETMSEVGGPEAAVEADVAPLVEMGGSTAPIGGILLGLGPGTSEVFSMENLIISPSVAEDENENVLVAKKSETSIEVVAQVVPSNSTEIPVIDRRMPGKENGKRVSIVEFPRDGAYMIEILGEEMSPTSFRRPSEPKETPGILKKVTRPTESESFAPKDDKVTDAQLPSNVQQD